MFPKRKFERVFWTTVDVSEPEDRVGLDPTMFGPSTRLTLLSSLRLLSSLPALNLVKSAPGKQVLVKVSRHKLHLHPGTRGRRLEGLSPSAPSNSIAAGPEMMGAASSMSSESTSCPSSQPRFAFLLPLGGTKDLSTNSDRERPCYHTSSCREQWRRQHPAESSHAQCSAQRRPGRCRPDPAGPARTAGTCE